MKKIISITLAFFIALWFVGCKPNTTKTNHTTDVEYYAKLGKIKEVEFSLGTQEKDLSDHYGDGKIIDAGDHEHYVELNRIEGNKTVRLDAGNLLFYYEKAKKEKGISAIISFDTAYDFEVGIAMPADIQNAITAKGTLTDATPEQLYFLPASDSDAKVLSYTFDNIRLDFFFINDFLSATVLTDTNNWTE